ncbi:hypothetical protein DPMN_010847 [Dreissena polymorpha]|uniref:Uncharacterized protein n=1 Tax=Dreissena polymorpha TaxID=45954 RepID=A0A9D4N3X2_DREPO|nr:hypothetical protein DPMN_010847 [Dreissena polymorpha]
MHNDMNGIHARWNYFETGHGKSACDGLGGTTKRMADEAIRQGNVTIQDAADFYAWAVQSSMKAIEFLYVSSDVTKKKRDKMALIKTKPVKGTLKLHAVGIKLEDNKTKLMTREMSCHCATCIAGSYCDSWAAQDIKCVTAINEERAYAVDETLGETEKEIQPSNDNDLPDTEDGAHGVEETLTETEKINEENIILNDIHIDDLVAAVYEGQWYIGRVEKKDAEEGDYKLNFMQRAKQMFKWPPKKDR